MARSARKISQTGIYHVVMRGVNHQNIFIDREDYNFFLRILYRIAKTDCLCDIFAYALMSNHFHILVDIPKDTEIGKVIKSLASKYAIYFNERHGRDGHLFQERFKSEPCEDENYFITLLRYIHQNPLKAGIVKRVDNYEYTSWHEYISEISDDKRVCNTTLPLGMIDKNSLIQLVNMPLNDARCIEYDDKTTKTISDNGITEHLLQNYNINNPLALQQLENMQRDVILCNLIDLGAGIRQLQRLTGIGKNIISRLSQNRSSQ